VTPYLVAIVAAALLAVLEGFARLGHFPWRGRAWAWWLARIGLEALVAVVFVGAADVIGIKVDTYELGDEWWGGVVLAFAGAVAARSPFGEGNTEPQRGANDGSDLSVTSLLPPGVYGIATFFAPTRLVIEQRLDESSSTEISRRLVDEMPLALDRAGLGANWIAARLKAWLKARKRMPAADRLAHIAEIDKTLNEDGVAEDEKIQLLLGRAVELQATGLLKDLLTQARRQAEEGTDAVPRQWWRRKRSS
jgi:hypothetical protein